jgi:hypothetical protein
MKKRWAKRRVSPSMGVAIVALVLALGAGAAYAKTHFIITSTSQIKPSVLAKLHGANGTNGSNGTRGPAGASGATGAAGAAGTNGTDGTDGTNGAPGPGAVAFQATVSSPGTDGPFEASQAEGTIPVELGCVNEDNSPPVASLLTTERDTSSGSGNSDATYAYGISGGAIVAEVTTTNLEQFNASGTTVLAGSGDAGSGYDITTGTALLTYVPVGGSRITETVTFELTTVGTETNSACVLLAQIVASS